MVSAIVLVNTDIAEQNKVLEQMKQVDGVEEAHALWGVYALLVKIKANSIEKIKEIIKNSLRQLDGVERTLTLIIDEKHRPAGG